MLCSSTCSGHEAASWATAGHPPWHELVGWHSAAHLWCHRTAWHCVYQQCCLQPLLGAAVGRHHCSSSQSGIAAAAVECYKGQESEREGPNAAAVMRHTCNRAAHNSALSAAWGAPNSLSDSQLQAVSIDISKQPWPCLSQRVSSSSCSGVHFMYTSVLNRRVQFGCVDCTAGQLFCSRNLNVGTTVCAECQVPAAAASAQQGARHTIVLHVSILYSYCRTVLFRFEPACA